MTAPKIIVEPITAAGREGHGTYRYRHGWIPVAGGPHPDDSVQGDHGTHMAGMPDAKKRADYARGLSDDDLRAARDDLKGAAGHNDAIDAAHDTVKKEIARRGGDGIAKGRGDGVNSKLDQVRDSRGAARDKKLQDMSDGDLRRVHAAAREQHAATNSPQTKQALADVAKGVRSELARRGSIRASAAPTAAARRPSPVIMIQRPGGSQP